MEVGFSEVMIIALLIIILFGPDKIPGIARDLGSGVRKMKGAVEEIKTEILKETENPVSEIKKEIDKVKKSVGKDLMADLESSESSKEEGSTRIDELNDDYSGPVSRR